MKPIGAPASKIHQFYRDAVKGSSTTFLRSGGDVRQQGQYQTSARIQLRYSEMFTRLRCSKGIASAIAKVSAKSWADFGQ